MFAVYSLLESPGTFRGIITDGASLTFDNAMILPLAEGKPVDAGIRGFLYLGVGNERETIPGLQAFTRILEKKAFPGLEWKMAVEADEDQGTAALPVFHRGLKWIYRDWRIPVEKAAAGPGAVRAHYAGLSEIFGYEIPASENALSARGFSLIREQRFADAGKAESSEPDLAKFCRTQAERLRKK